MSVQYRYSVSPELDEIIEGANDGARSFRKLKKQNPELWPIVQKKLKIRWTTDSNALEGSTLSYAETLFFLEEGLTVEGKPLKDFLDARNHSDAIEYLMGVIKDDRPITTYLMKEINALLLNGVTSTPAIDQSGKKTEKSATPGEYKTWPNHVLQPDGTIHKYVDPIHVATEMEALVTWINDQTGKRDPVIIAAIAHYNFVRIHPFDDGNGRGARILMNLILMKSDLVPAVIEKEKRREYIRYLRQADSGELDSFILFISIAVMKTLSSAIDDYLKVQNET